VLFFVDGLQNSQIYYAKFFYGLKQSGSGHATLWLRPFR